MPNPTTVSYNGSKIEPAPLINISKNYQTTGDGTKIGSLFQITVQGTLIAVKGSPDSSGTFYTGSAYWPDARNEPSYEETLTEEQRLASIIRKQEALRQLFNTDGYSFEVQSGDGSQPLKCNPRILNITFPPGIWYEVCPYTITMEADVVYINGALQGEDSFTDKISSANEDWSIETLEDTDIDSQHTFRLTHNVSATGKRYYDETGSLVKEAWEQARDYVQAKIGYDATKVTPSKVGDLSTINQYNHVRSERIDELGGQYSINENWILAENNYTETFEVSTQLSEGEIRVSINGSVNGLETRDSNMTLDTSKISAAEARWGDVEGLLLSRAQTYSETTLNTIPLNYNVSRNITAGIITYGYEYTDITNIFTDAITESIQVSSSTNVDVFGEIFVLGRTDGPVLQDLGTKRGKTKSLAIEAVFPVTTVSYDNPLTTTYSSTLDTIIDSVKPASDAFIEENSETWDARTGRATFNRSWKWD